jgi:hypothetical protein
MNRESRSPTGIFTILAILWVGGCAYTAGESSEGVQPADRALSQGEPEQAAPSSENAAPAAQDDLSVEPRDSQQEATSSEACGRAGAERWIKVGCCNRNNDRMQQQVCLPNRYIWINTTRTECWGTDRC